MKPRPRDEFPARVRREAHRRSGGKCEKCQTAFTRENPVDYHHIIAASAGGPGTLENCMTLCFRCHRPGSKLPANRLNPPIGGQIIPLRLNQALLTRINAWRAAHGPFQPAMATTLRHLVDLGLEASASSKNTRSSE